MRPLAKASGVWLSLPESQSASRSAHPAPRSERVHGELQILKHFVAFASLLGWAMRDLVVLFLHLLATVARLAGAGGARAVVAESSSSINC